MLNSLHRPAFSMNMFSSQVTIYPHSHFMRRPVSQFHVQFVFSLFDLELIQTCNSQKRNGVKEECSNSKSLTKHETKHVRLVVREVQLLAETL